ncbi:Stage V sporulation protein T [compost metagenome]
MKSIGIIRSLDSLGHITIPKEIREVRELYEGDPVEFFLDDEAGILSFRKFIGSACCMCGAIDKLSYFKDYFLCPNCIDQMKLMNNFEPAINRYKPIINIVHKEPKKPSLSTQYLAQKLREVIEQKPDLKQIEYAAILGLSQPRISQLKKLLK